jgi:hypothetical protein
MLCGYCLLEGKGLMVAQLLPKLLPLLGGHLRHEPNKANVTTKRLEAGVWDEKPTHYLMETHVL